MPAGSVASMIKEARALSGSWASGSVRSAAPTTTMRAGSAMMTSWRIEETP
jgi:hypothetical protein